MEVLAEIVGPDELRTASILDFGCGTGHLLTWLRRTHRYEGSYTGYDIAGAMIQAARALHASDPGASFERRDIGTEGVGGDFDLVLVSGTFNNVVSDNWRFLTDHLRILFPHARRGLSFNCLSSYVDYTTEGLAHRRPEDVFSFVKAELTPRVALRHDYHVKDDVIPFEFTVYAYASEHDPVADRGTAP